MAKVTNLKIQLQSGTDNTYFASWSFKTTTSSTNSNGIKVGDLVSISSSATYYNGASIPSWVKSDKWYISQVSGDRAVLGKNQSGSNNIQSPVNTKYLSKGSSSSSSVASNTLDHYEVKWQYDTGNNVWFEGSSSTTNYLNTTYNPPDNALNIRVWVKPVSKTYTDNNKEKSYWTGEYTTCKLQLAGTAPETPPTPSVEIENYKITATVEGIQDARTDKILFLIYNAKGRAVKSSGQVTVINQRATYSCNVDVGQYQVRCRAVNIYSKSKIYSPYSDFSGVLTTAPASPKKFTSIKAASETEVQLDWADVSGATSYEIEYTTKQRYFDSSSEVSSTTIDAKVASHAEITGLSSGEQYFFRIRAANDQGVSAWSTISSVIVGKKPAAPTTWSSSTTVIAGTDLNLYWVHNSEDGSSQTYAQLEIYINGVKESHTVKNSTDEDEKDKTSVYSIDTSSYAEGTKIEWRVRTRGILAQYGDWSIQRTIDIYGVPTLQLSVTDSTDEDVTDTLTSFPFYISALAGPQTQSPIGYHVSIIANESYEDVDNVGNIQTISEGSEVYSKYYDTSNNPLELELTAGSVNLENGISYTIICTASMDSGLTATESFEFTVEWTDETYIVDARISIDDDTLVAYIAPYCTDEEGVFADNVLMSVYRREYDGNFTEISSNIDNSLNATVTDPHPALDYARYRIVAKDTTTGSITYYDVPGQPIGEKSVVIQWDETWTWYDVENEDEMVEPPWAGSMLKLPYNIDISDSNSKDVSLVSYIGRKHPVSYYGTQLGVTSTWNVEIEKSDTETLYALRRLAIWTGDVYVREPSGSGYWANISVSFNQKHCEVTIPVTLNITRVEGGM